MKTIRFLLTITLLVATGIVLGLALTVPAWADEYLYYDAYWLSGTIYVHGPGGGECPGGIQPPCVEVVDVQVGLNLPANGPQLPGDYLNLYLVYRDQNGDVVPPVIPVLLGEGIDPNGISSGRVPPVDGCDSQMCPYGTYNQCTAEVCTQNVLCGHTPGTAFSCYASIPGWCAEPGCVDAQFDCNQSEDCVLSPYDLNQACQAQCPQWWNDSYYGAWGGIGTVGIENCMDDGLPEGTECTKPGPGQPCYLCKDNNMGNNTL